MFKVGDNVVCIRGDSVYQLVEGHIYTVLQSDLNHITVRSGNGAENWWCKERFTLAPVVEVKTKQDQEPEPSVYEKQVGGTHYKVFPDGYQPIQIGMKLNLTPIEYSILKYLLRYKLKGTPVQDIKKLIHFSEMLLAETEKEQ